MHLFPTDLIAEIQQAEGPYCLMLEECLPDSLPPLPPQCDNQQVSRRSQVSPGGKTTPCCEPCSQVSKEDPGG